MFALARDVALGFLFIVLPMTALVFAWRMRRQHVDPWPLEEDGNDW